MTEWPFTPASQLGRYDDLIFVPLDLPPPPTIDPLRFVEWMQATADPRTSAPSFAYRQSSGREYPWLMTSIVGDLAPLQKCFPEVADYFSVYPLRTITHAIFLAQRGHQAVFKHTDSDGLYGMRLYLTSKNAEGLHFYRGRERYDAFPTYARSPEGELKCADWDRYFRTDEPIYASLPPESRAFHLNSARAVHAVDENTCELGDRIAVLVCGEVDHDRRDDLISRSLKRYGEHAIWY